MERSYASSRSPGSVTASRFDYSFAESYIHSMNRGLIAAAILAVLTILGGIDFLEDTGVVHFSSTEMDRSLDEVLDKYGEAIRSAQNDLTDSRHPTVHVSGSYRSSAEDFVSNHLDYSARRKQSLDFSRSAFDPLSYSKILLV
jgi:hypothetical protein